MTQVINHDLGYKIVHNLGFDFDLGYDNKSEFFHYPGFKFVSCAGYAQGGRRQIFYGGAGLSRKKNFIPTL